MQVTITGKLETVNKLINLDNLVKAATLMQHIPEYSSINVDLEPDENDLK